MNYNLVLDFVFMHFYTCNICVGYYDIYMYYTCSSSHVLHVVIGMGKPWYWPFSIFPIQLKFNVANLVVNGPFFC